MFAQLKAIIDEEPPTLPSHFSEEAHSFISDWQVLPIFLNLILSDFFHPLLLTRLNSLRKDANQRPTYSQLLQHPFIQKYEDIEVDMAAWALSAYGTMKERAAKPSC
jgi:mitogen-activated protein kinase kinase